jgi:4-hydroxybenzoate polyprenyltransferase
VPLLPLLRLVRIGTLFSPAADVVASVAVARLPWNAEALAAVAASVCLYAGGMVWNDFADRELDAVQRPERPLPRGQVSAAVAAAIGTALFAAALLLSPCPAYHAVMAALVLAYDFGSKRLAVLGVFGMGVLRGLNLGTALAFAGDAVANDARGELLAAAACYAIYIVAVTVLGIFEDTPKVRARAVSAVQVAPPVAALCGLWVVQGGAWPAPLIMAVPVVWFLRGNVHKKAWEQGEIRRAMTWLLLGTMVYTSLLALAANRPFEALGIALVIVPARWISRRIALT